MTVAWCGTILGEPASKANSRRIVTVGRGRHAQRRVIKSEKALGWVATARAQIARQRPAALLEGRLRFEAVIYYRSERPDLDASLLLDVLQGVVFRNDRQCREQHLYHAIDKANPRSEIVVQVIG